jgi:putative aminopeptidase FrvX
LWSANIKRCQYLEVVGTWTINLHIYYSYHEFMNVFTPSSEDFLQRYLNNASPTGFEAPGQQIWADYMRNYVDELRQDNYGTVYGVINPDSDFRVVIEAHADEIAWYVSHIDEKGFIGVIRNGGSDHLIAPSKIVHLHGEKGIVKGVFGWPAIHTRHGKNAELKPEIENIFIDIGAANKDEVAEMGVHIGTVITYPDEVWTMNDRYIVGRALDNRMGGFCIAQVGRLLKEKNIKLPFGLYIVNSVQEEVGLRGAEMITQTIKPHVAIVTDVTHDTTTPLMNARTQGYCKAGEGPELTVAPAVHNKLLGLVVEAAKEKEIPFQRSASSRYTGTDTDAFAFSNGGVPSVLISLPLRYMHTTVESAHKADIENVTKLIYETLQKIEYKHNFKYLNL